MLGITLTIFGDPTLFAVEVALEPDPSLQHRMDLFRETGRVSRVPNELFAENSWIQVMMGQGVAPEQHHPVADLMNDEQLSRFLDVIRSNVDNTVKQLPTHMGYLRSYCPAPALAR